MALVLGLVAPARFVKVAVMAGADCNVNPEALVGHVKITYAPEGLTVSCGGGTSNERLKTVPLPELPASYAVPYRVLPDRINPADGSAPSVLVPVFISRAVKLYRFLKPEASVSTLNTVPLLELPPPAAVPYRVLPDKISTATG